MSRPVALIRGVGRRVGIAPGIAAKLAADGWDIGFCYFTPYDARFDAAQGEALAIADDLRALGAAVSPHEVELADPDAAVQLMADVAADLGTVTALVLSHAESVDSDIFTTTVDAFDRHNAVNARAAWLLIREFALQLPSGTPGAIVGLTSDHVAGNLAYGASKGSLDRVLLGAAGELAARGIRSNIVNPGPIDTGWMDDAIRASGLARQPTGRLGMPSDTAELVSFLVSPASAWITGQLIKSDGGFSL